MRCKMVMPAKQYVFVMLARREHKNACVCTCVCFAPTTDEQINTPLIKNVSHYTTGLGLGATRAYTLIAHALLRKVKRAATCDRAPHPRACRSCGRPSPTLIITPKWYTLASVPQRTHASNQTKARPICPDRRTAELRVASTKSTVRIRLNQWSDGGAAP